MADSDGNVSESLRDVKQGNDYLPVNNDPKPGTGQYLWFIIAINIYLSYYYIKIVAYT